jgi:hypothetical protein
MTRYNGIYVASYQAIAHTAADLLFELNPTGSAQFEVLRMWISPAHNAVDDVQEIDVYENDAVATGGTQAAKRDLQGGSDDAGDVVVDHNKGTIGATPSSLWHDAFHLLNGWLYVPVPEERPRKSSAQTDLYFGLRLSVAPAESITLSYGVVWGELT